MELCFTLCHGALNVQVTAQKIRIASSADTFKAMSEFIAPENIPVEYGGKLKFGDEKDGCR
jgi:hypothetical protein